MSDLRTAAQKVVDAWGDPLGMKRLCEEIEALRAALAQEQPSPINQCGETCERAKLCAICAREIEQEQPDTDCHAQGVCQRSGYSIGGRKPLMEAEVERKSAAIQRLWKERDSLREQNAALMKALKSTGLFLQHCWCDVQMNNYSFEKLIQQMIVVDAAIAKAEGAKES